MIVSQKRTNSASVSAFTPRSRSSRWTCRGSRSRRRTNAVSRLSALSGERNDATVASTLAERESFLRSARKELTQDHLADLTGLSARHIGAIERGNKSATVTVLGKIADAFKIDPADLIRRQEKTVCGQNPRSRELTDLISRAGRSSASGGREPGAAAPADPLNGSADNPGCGKLRAGKPYSANQAVRLCRNPSEGALRNTVDVRTG